MAEEEPVKSSGNLPEKKFTSGSVDVTIWENHRKDGDKTVRFNTIVIDKSYKDKSGDWKKTNAFNPSDLNRVYLLVAEALGYLYIKEH